MVAACHRGHLLDRLCSVRPALKQCSRRVPGWAWRPDKLHMLGKPVPDTRACACAGLLQSLCLALIEAQVSERGAGARPQDRLRVVQLHGWAG
eukprot:CAMPEP_0168416262 /NCGR_PEP_ID=MMETSP0228-20121227/30652_1 /TAXON_ID=133427 /ORGANISM="Protoceratium reticulatum, Strain CCCM 535 (=CCMP 1889)" /LENGTH=92 /DNA_ID=CAMNT_0008430087 /DNA_START=29 /DNA_END=303 /DNA_ORIENTATION=+